MSAAAEPPLPLAQESPIQTLIQDWLDFLEGVLPVAFLVIVILVGIVLIVRSRGGLQKAIVFGIGAALVFLILTNVEAVSGLFGEELRIDGD